MASKVKDAVVWYQKKVRPFTFSRVLQTVKDYHVLQLMCFYWDTLEEIFSLCGKSVENQSVLQLFVMIKKLLDKGLLSN